MGWVARLGASDRLCHYFRAVILALTLFFLYCTSAWVMLRSATNPRLSPIAWALVVATIFGHSDAIVRMMRIDGPVAIGLLEALSLFAWTLAILACLLCIERQNRVLGSILLACAAFGAAVTGSGRTYAEENAPGWELTSHILLSMGATALLFAAAVTAILLVTLDRRLRARRLMDLPPLLPPLDALERVMFRLIAAGFILLTLALLTGFIFVTDLLGQHLIHKTVFSITAWVLFAMLLFGRTRYGWRGRSAVRWTLTGFGTLAIAYFGDKFILETLLGRHWG